VRSVRSGRQVHLCAARLSRAACWPITSDMGTEAIGGASSQLASVLAAAAAQESQLGLVEAQINASQAAGDGAAAAISSSAQAPGTLEVFA
jgi:replication-associated recombination protein RarA